MLKKEGSNSKNYILHKKSWEDRLKYFGNHKKYCEYYIVKDGISIDTYKLSYEDLIKVFLCNKNVNLSEIICEEQKISTFSSLRDLLKCSHGLDEKKFKKIVTQLGGGRKFLSIKLLAEKYEMSLDEVTDLYFQAEVNPEKGPADFRVNSNGIRIPTSKHVKLRIPRAPKTPKNPPRTK